MRVAWTGAGLWGPPTGYMGYPLEGSVNSRAASTTLQFEYRVVEIFI